MLPPPPLLCRVEPPGWGRYDVALPYLSCPSGNVTRVGGQGDGSKLLCLEGFLNQPGCIIYSLGRWVGPRVCLAASCTPWEVDGAPLWASLHPIMLPLLHSTCCAALPVVYGVQFLILFCVTFGMARRTHSSDSHDAQRLFPLVCTAPTPPTHPTPPHLQQRAVRIRGGHAQCGFWQRRGCGSIDESCSVGNCGFPQQREMGV